MIERRKEEAEQRAKDAAAEAAELALEAETRRKAQEAVRTFNLMEDEDDRVEIRRGWNEIQE